MPDPKGFPRKQLLNLTLGLRRNRFRQLDDQRWSLCRWNFSTPDSKHCIPWKIRRIPTHAEFAACLGAPWIFHQSFLKCSLPAMWGPSESGYAFSHTWRWKDDERWWQLMKDESSVPNGDVCCIPTMRPSDWTAPPIRESFQVAFQSGCFVFNCLRLRPCRWLALFVASWWLHVSYANLLTYASLDRFKESTATCRKCVVFRASRQSDGLWNGKSIHGIGSEILCAKDCKSVAAPDIAELQK